MHNQNRIKFGGENEENLFINRSARSFYKLVVG